MKSFLITTSAPICGTECYYSAFAESEDDVYDWLYANWFDEECQALWESYSFHCEDEWEAEWEELSKEERIEYENDYEKFLDQKNMEWCNDCGLSVEETDEEELKMYSVSGQGIPEIVYDERNNSTNN